MKLIVAELERIAKENDEVVREAYIPKFDSF